MQDQNSFVIEDGILKQYVGKDADVIIPAGVTEIGYEAFKGNKTIERVTIPEGVKNISRDAFSYCGKLVCLIVADPDARIQSFGNCKNLIYIKASPMAINYCMSFFSASMKAALCYGYLKSDDVNEAYNAAVKRCKKKVLELIAKDDDPKAATRYLETYKKPLSINDIDDLITLFIGCENVTAVLLSYKRTNYSEQQIEDNSLVVVDKEFGLKERTLKEWRKVYSLSIQGETIAIVSYKGSEPVVHIPEVIDGKKVTSLQSAFENRADLIEVTLPESMQFIGWNAFSNCIGLREIVIPGSVTEIGMEAFSGCANLEHVTFSGSEQLYCDETAFSGCPKLSICGKAGSPMESIAKEYGIPFIAE